MSELKDWKDACACLKSEANKSEEEIKQKRNYVNALSQKEQQIRSQIKGKEDQNKGVYDYNIGLDLMIEKNDNDISKLRQNDDNLAKTAMTL